LNAGILRRALAVYLVLLIPVCWLAARFDPYGIDGDSVAYMDIADLIRTHQWAGVVNGYWNPLYPAVLAVGQVLFHPTRMNERSVYVMMNFGVFLLQVAAVLLFVGALVRLREKLKGPGGNPLLSFDAMRLLGAGLVMSSSHREMAMGKVRPDGLLQVLLLAGFTMMLQVLTTGSTAAAAAMGLFFGLAYLTKSVAFVVTLVSVAVMMAFQWWIERRPLRRVVFSAAVVGAVFAMVAGPYVAALSMQKHRFDFGDSGSLNYAWFAAGTQKFHLEPEQTERFGSSSVHLIHPVPRLLTWPAIYSYKVLRYGTDPNWFDPTYFNERIVPHPNLRLLVKRDARNAMLLGRYLLNHPEGWMLLTLLLMCGAQLSLGRWRQESFWAPTMLIGLAMWGIYGLVNIEERYVTVAYLAILLPVFAALRTGRSTEAEGDETSAMRRLGAGMVAVLAFLLLGNTLLTALENRRNGAVFDERARQVYGAAQGLAEIGVKPGDEVACLETTACVTDPYWGRLAGVRVLTEVENSGSPYLLEELDSLPNRQEVYDIVKAQGAQVLVAAFDAGTMTNGTAASKGWIRLGGTNFFALPLNLPAPTDAPMVSRPWTSGNEEP
jgi:hypothetical protein